MDFSKYPLEKLVYFVAGIIPGFVALLIFEIAAPGSFKWFFDLGFLGYRTKLSLILLAAFVVGNSMTTFLHKFLAGTGGAIQGGLGYKPPHLYDSGPWRHPRWRAALRNYLGVDAPDDTHPMRDQLYQLRLRQIELQPAAQRPLAIAELNIERLKTESDDSDWARWYDQFHATVLRPTDQDVLFHVQRGLSFNLETAGVYVLISAVFVPRLRHWWCLLPAILWALTLILEETGGFRQMTNKWSTLSTQITYLTELGRTSPHSQGTPRA